MRGRNCVGPRSDSRVNIFKVGLASNIALDTACQIGKLTASFSAAQRDIQQARFEELISRADQHLDLAKQQGRDRVCSGIVNDAGTGMAPSMAA